ncbi:MAG: hypothetical protein M3163_15945 [Actinomycetota bacterium]|nr:hypothetical protein [Actinomycetota bacterium]
MNPVPSTRTRLPTAALDGVAVTWGMPLTSRGVAVVGTVEAPAAGRVVVTLVDVAGATVELTGTVVVDVVVGAVGTGPSDRAPLSEQPLSTTRPMTARAGIERMLCRRMPAILAGDGNRAIAVA